MAKKNLFNPYNKGDLDRINTIRRDIVIFGGSSKDLGQLRNSQVILDKIYDWAFNDRKVAMVGDIDKVVWSILVTVDRHTWNEVGRRDVTEKRIGEVLDNHMNKITVNNGQSLWQFVATRRTTSQIGSGMALIEWQKDTRKMFKLFGDELTLTYRG